MNSMQKVMNSMLFLCMGAMIFAGDEVSLKKAQAQSKISIAQAKAQAKVLAQQKAEQLQQEKQAKKQSAPQKKAAAQQKAPQTQSEKIDKKCQILFYHEKTKELVGVMKELKEVETEKDSKSQKGFLVNHKGTKKHLDGVCHHPHGDKGKDGKDQKGQCDSHSKWYYFHCAQDEKSGKKPAPSKQ